MLNTRRKVIYWLTYTVTLAVGLLLLGCFLRPEPGHAWNPGLAIYQFVCLHVPLAALLATRLCRRLKLSLETTTTEEIRACGVPRTPEGEVVLGKIPWWSRWVWPVTSMVAVMAGIGVWFASDRSWGAVTMVALTSVIICFLPVVNMNWLRRAITRLDESGITQTYTDGTRAETVAWEEIDHCKLHIRRDALDRIAEATIVLFDPTGKELSKMDVTRMPEAERQQLLETLRGGPAATELEAAEAPAGRGSELEASDEPLRGDPVREGERSPMVARQPGR